MPLCATADATSCLLDWNTVAARTDDAARRASRLIWLEGRYQPLAARRPVCVNPLNWTPDGAAPAAEALRAPVQQLTGAQCTGGLLNITIPWGERRGFLDPLSLFGSYHIFDYNIFYLNIRSNALGRVAAHRSRAPAAR